MVKIKTNTSKSGSTITCHNIMIDVIPANTYAALICLNDFLKKQDVDYLAEKNLKNRYHYKERIAFSRNYLHAILRETGNLICTYCNKADLIIEEEGMIVKSNIKATIDHVVPISKGGTIFSTKNIVVACQRCNRKKDNMTLHEFLQRYKKILNPDYEILKRFL